MSNTRRFLPEDYVIRTTRISSTGEIKPSPWMHYDLRVPGFENSDDYPKVHISLEQTPENLVKAQKVIELTLIKYQLVAIKIATAASLKAFKTDKNLPDDHDILNTSGKELTVYMHTRINADNKNPEFWKKLFFDLEQQLTAAGVKPNPRFKSVGDAPLPGSDWISYRDQDNVFRMYIEANALQMNGFTRNEAANLTGRFKRFFSIPDTKVRNDDEKAIVVKLSDTTPLHEGIHERYKTDLKNSREVLFGKDPIIDSPFNKKYVYPFLYLFSRDQQFRPFHHEGLLPCLHECLVEAAKYTALLRKSLHDAGMIPDNQEIQLGNILPAIYHHFIKPIVQKAMHRKSDLYAADANRERLIREIVKCSFRQRASHIDTDIPRYVYGLNDATLDKLLGEIEVRNSFSYQATEFLKKNLGVGLVSMFKSEKPKPAAQAPKPPQPVKDEKINKPK